MQYLLADVDNKENVSQFIAENTSGKSLSAWKLRLFLGRTKTKHLF